MEFTSRRKRTARLSVRFVGVVFAAGAVIFIIRTLSKQMSAGSVLLIMVAAVFLFVGCSYVMQSFNFTAYDTTYYILPDELKVKGHKKELTVAYDTISSVTLSKVGEDMDYYLLHIITPKQHFILHVENQEEYAKKMYDQLMDYTGLPRGSGEP